MRDRLPETIETARLLLRPPHVSDLDDLIREINNPKVLEPTASLPFPYLPDHGHAFLTKRERTGQHPYVIADRQTDRLLGVIGLYFVPDQPVELGYWLGERFWGQGFAPEAVDALVNAAIGVGISPIRARVLKSNPGSLRVLEKADFALLEETVSAVERHLGKPLLVLERR
ncbi:GNAT family N-acetyltransferase [Devosia rhizoryzae]|uniref:GNAT family N-acetyltransferase n=1 Tax=Devosia rhizoryzae TaxID=2774137 RepID=A0ABX7CBD8_9HYPH|nr:GNAT family N-acetyltransferase [Devosia rhizoryzae]QQR39251.1 GNAT family N-acetyltransferase [Devosia rhizoryzae]